MDRRRLRRARQGARRGLTAARSATAVVEPLGQPVDHRDDGDQSASGLVVQIAVGIADVATDLVLVLLRRRQRLSTPGARFGVHGLDVGKPDIEEATDPTGVAWRTPG
jgi:hypothetical protein